MNDLRKAGLCAIIGVGIPFSMAGITAVTGPSGLWLDIPLIVLMVSFLAGFVFFLLRSDGEVWS